MKKLLSIAIIILLSISTNAQDTTHVTVQVGAGSKYASINVVDKVTGSYVSATITNVTVQNNNPEFATVAPNPSNPNSIRVTAVAEGNGTALVSCNVSYVDPGDGQTKNEAKTIVISFNVIAAPHGVKLSLTFN
jgi:hypothetical protein